MIISGRASFNGLEVPQRLDKIVFSVFGQITDLEHGLSIVIANHIVPGTIIPDANQNHGIAGHLFLIQVFYFHQAVRLSKKKH